MKPANVFLLFATVAACVQAADRPSVGQQVDAVFTELRALKSMQRNERYTLPARGKDLSGRNDDFLRRRTAAEISESGLSCGCGDYALVFIERIQQRGFETLLVDAAQLSYQSLISKFSGHAVVAVRPASEPKAAWWLVDSTARKVLSREWSPDAKSFTASGQVYWIGYCGPVEEYPARSPAELKRFYSDTLATVPPEVLNRTLPKLMFTIDPSMRDGKGGNRNPNLERLWREQERVFATYNIQPEREVSILLIAGDNDARGELKHTNDGWVARVGLQSACSPSFLNYMEGVIRRHADAGH